MDNEAHYYAQGYGAENDPYILENGVLVNKLGLVDTQSINEIEADIAAIEITRLLGEDVAVLWDAFNLAHLRDLHVQIFHRIYPWAGELRKVDIGKGSTVFVPHRQIERETSKLFDELASSHSFEDVDAEAFSRAIGPFLVRLNFIHPFREGNGRVQRLLISQIARHKGFLLDWRAVGNEAMRQACLDGIQGNSRQMARLILMNLS